MPCRCSGWLYCREHHSPTSWQSPKRLSPPGLTPLWPAPTQVPSSPLWLPPETKGESGGGGASPRPLLGLCPQHRPRAGCNISDASLKGRRWCKASCYSTTARLRSGCHQMSPPSPRDPLPLLLSLHPALTSPSDHYKLRRAKSSLGMKLGWARRGPLRVTLPLA